MIVERSMAPGWLSNSYVVGDRAGGHAVLIDAGGPVEQILEAIERFRLTVTHVLLTHHHGDHVAQLDAYRERFGVPALAHPLEAARLDGVEGTLADGDVVSSGDLRIRCLHTPGHLSNHVCYAERSRRCLFSGDHVMGWSTSVISPPSQIAPSAVITMA